MKKKSAVSRIRMLARRAASGLMALVLVCGLLPAVTQPVRAVDWAQEYLDKLVEWDIMRGDIDGNLHSERNITRAEFVTLINRAYGYEELGVTPFIDVDSTAWYAEDISIAYNVGYFTGTSDTTAEPDLNLSREQAALVMGRNMMLQPTTGEVLGFSDSRDFSEWSRDMIQSVATTGVITGYPNGTFGPQNNITRGEMACMLVKAIGTPIRESGEYTLGNVYGNVTISTSGVTLRNTTIAGDLYLTGGIALGDVLLENVTVLGRIVASGAGESNMGDNSIILRNVTASEMVVDSIDNQFVTVRSEGDTAIDNVSVRTPAYLEDVAPSGQGLRVIQLDGESGNSLYLAGNIKEVINLTPNSSLYIAQGAAEKVTIDETATNAVLNIDGSARVNELNLDVGTIVTGTGDIEALNVNAAGSIVASLPDTITIRPGLTATINGKSMDSTAAAESSADPHLLAGYPTAKDVAPTSTTLVFSTNKAGTIYWAISALADGSVSEDDVISPPTYATSIIKSGTINATASKTEYTAKVTGLTSDGGYYITAILVDGRGQHSPLKVAAFATPDDSVPNFATGYPVMSRITNSSAQVTVMTTKSCQLYYALLPKNSTAPTAQDFKTGSVSGNMGYGTMDAVKNSTLPFTVNSIDLEELESYDLYLWLTDYDGAKSSAVKKLTFTTIDGTPPLVRHMDQTDTKATSATLTYALNEPGTLYWAAVQVETEFFRPVTGTSVPPEMTDEAAKIQVEAGIGAIKKGSSSASKADTDVNLTISGLKAETSYDVYYVAKDKAGNYSDSVQVVTIHTLDTNAPSVTQEFTSFNETEVGGVKVQSPLAETDIRLVFSETVQGVITDVLGQRVYQPFKDKTGEELAEILRQHITMYEVVDGARNLVRERNSSSDRDDLWVIDYRNAVIAVEDGKLIVTFPTTSDSGTSALNLSSGATYFFHVSGIADTALPPNIMASQDLPTFRTVYAQINLSNNDVGTIKVDGEEQRLDISLNLRPVSTRSVPDTECWDLLIWCDTPVEFDVYRQVIDTSSNNKVVSAWEYIGSAEMTPRSGNFSGVSLYSDVMISSGQAVFDQLKQLNENYTYQYGIQFTNVNDLTDYNTWSSMVTMKFSVAAGGSGDLRTLAGNVTDNWEDLKADQSITSIGMAYSATATSDELTLRRQFTDRSTPAFLENSPTFVEGSSTVVMNLALDRDGTIYYVVAPKTEYPPAISGANISSGNDSDPAGNIQTYIPKTGSERTTYPGYAGSENNPLTSPTYRRVVNPTFSNSPNIKTGTVSATGYVTHEIAVGGLIPETEYYVYYVIQGGGEIFSTVECYQFKTSEVETPVITLQNASPSASMSTSTDANLWYALVEYNHLPDWIRSDKFTPDSSLTLPAGGIPSTIETVLDAMINIADAKTGQSYFDLYGDSELKDRVLRYINGDLQLGTAQEPQRRGSLMAMQENKAQLIDFSNNMDPDVEYVVLSTACHVYGESYGYKAVRAIYLPDSVAPSYTGMAYLQPGSVAANTKADFTGTTVDRTEWEQNPSAYYYSGTITITFDKNIYYVDGSNVRWEVWNIAPSGVGTDGFDSADRAVSLFSILGGGVSSKLSPNSTIKRAGSTFSIDYKGLSDGDQIILFDGGNISNGNSITTTKKLYLIFDTSLMTSDYSNITGAALHFPGFRAEWR